MIIFKIPKSTHLRLLLFGCNLQELRGNNKLTKGIMLLYQSFTLKILAGRNKHHLGYLDSAAAVAAKLLQLCPTL